MVSGLTEVLDRNRILNEVIRKKGYAGNFLELRRYYALRSTPTWSQYYCELLERMYNILGERYHAIVNRKRVIPYTSKMKMDKIKEFDGIEIHHSPYSPDLLPSNYYLFRSYGAFP